MNGCRPAQVLQLFLGEGDQYAAWEQLPLEPVSWYSVPQGAVQQMATASAVQRWQKRSLRHAGGRRRLAVPHHALEHLHE